MKTLLGVVRRGTVAGAVLASAAVVLVLGFSSRAIAQETGLPIFRACNHPCINTVRFAERPPSLDQLQLHAGILPSSSIDPATEPVSIGLANSGGFFVAVTLPPGSFRALSGGRWAYNNPTARKTGGLSAVRIWPRRTPTGSYRVNAFYWGDLSAATESTMTTLVRIDDDLFTDTAAWNQTQHGWSYDFLP